MKEVIDYLNNIIDENDTLIIGCSSGPDSMCLLSIVQKLSKKANIICAHVNHNLRKESEKEYKYLKDYCLEHNIIFEGAKIDQKLTNNIEEEARKFRYSFFYDLKKKYCAKFILTAHHADDLMETILMRITRGSNLSGYAGIKMIDKDFLRPLLYVTKRQIIDYNTANNIKYFIDATNKSDKHTRNRFRNHVIPFFKEENSEVYKKFIQFSIELQNYNDFVVQYIENKKLIKDNCFIISNIKKEEKLIQRKVIEQIIKNIQKDNYLDVSNQKIDSILDLIESNKSNAKIDLGNNFIALKEYDKITVLKDEKKEHNKEEVLADMFENDLWKISKIKSSLEKSNMVIRLNSKEIKLPIIVRYKKDSDKMNVKNLGTKKVKDIFIDSKIPTKERKTWPIVVDSSGNILWIPGIKKSKFDKEKNEKYDIILLSERK